MHAEERGDSRAGARDAAALRLQRVRCDHLLHVLGELRLEERARTAHPALAQRRAGRALERVCVEVCMCELALAHARLLVDETAHDAPRVDEAALARGVLCERLDRSDKGLRQGERLGGRARGVELLDDGAVAQHVALQLRDARRRVAARDFAGRRRHGAGKRGGLRVCAVLPELLEDAPLLALPIAVQCRVQLVPEVRHGLLAALFDEAQDDLLVLVPDVPLDVRVVHGLERLERIRNVRALDRVRELCSVNPATREQVVRPRVCSGMSAARILAHKLAALALDLVDAKLDRWQVRVAAQLVHQLAGLLQQVDERSARSRRVVFHRGREQST